MSDPILLDKLMRTKLLNEYIEEMSKRNKRRLDEVITLK